MSLRLFNTLTKTKEDFAPLDAKNVRMYVCGPTVYDFAHIGNARPAIVFDVLFRLLRHEYGAEHVTYVRNITDVDDKINERALRDFPGLPLNEAIRNVTEKTEKQYHDDVAALGCLPPTFEPRATEFVLPRSDGKVDMVSLIAQLIARGHAYEAGGEVLFDTQSMPDYGRLSGRKLDEQQAGARVDVDAHKKHPHDFVLWKLSADNEPGWESPWGRGRPGWHIECSAMSTCCLGNHFDIHGGGMDLQFPHHENEIAQSEGATGEKFVNFWMHNGFVRVNEEKMSKSLGNFFTVREVLKQYRPEIIRFFILSSHYRSPLNYSDEQLNDAGTALTRLYTALRGIEITDVTKDTDYENRFKQAMDDDFNTPVALSVLFDLARELNKAKESGHETAANLAATLKYLGGLLGLLQNDANEFLQGDSQGIDVEQQIQARIDAKKSKDWALADKIRDDLKALGVILEDAPNGTTLWRHE